MRICAIGNSHLGAVKLGWDRLSRDRPDVSIDFYGSIGQTLKDVRADARTLAPTTEEVERSFRATSGSSASIDVDAYDSIVVVGSGLSLHWIVNIYSQVRAEHHVRGDEYLVSDAVFGAAVEQNLSSSAAMHLQRTLLDMGRSDVVLMPNPRPGAGLNHYPNIPTWEELARNGDGSEIAGRFESYLTAQEAGGVSILRQPEDSLQDALFSREAFSLVAADGALDAAHMNEAYGVLAVTELLAYLAARRA